MLRSFSSLVSGDLCDDVDKKWVLKEVVVSWIAALVKLLEKGMLLC